MDDSILSILLLVFGVCLFVGEVFVPSGGLLSVLAVAMVGGSYYFAWQEWHDTAPSVFWGFVVLSLFATPSSIIGAFYLLPRTRFGRKVLLEGPELREVTPFARERQHLSELIGKRGVTAGLLNPGGLVELNGERLHCESEGTIVDPGVPVVVIGVRGNSVIVRELDEREAVKPSPEAAEDASSTEQIEQLDFEMTDE